MNETYKLNAKGPFPPNTPKYNMRLPQLIISSKQSAMQMLNSLVFPTIPPAIVLPMCLYLLLHLDEGFHKLRLPEMDFGVTK